MKIAISICVAAPVLVLSACGSSNDNNSGSSGVTNPASLPDSVEVVTYDLNGQRVGIEVSDVDAVYENENVYAVKGTPIVYNGQKIYVHGIHYNEKTKMIGTRYYEITDGVFAEVDVETPGTLVMDIDEKNPVAIDTTYYGAYSELNGNTGDQTVGNAWIFVDGQDHYMTVTGPEKLQGVDLIWNEKSPGNYFYEGSEMGAFGWAGSNRAEVIYEGTPSSGVTGYVFGHK